MIPQHIIDAAPDEREEITALRKTRRRTKATEVGDALAKAGFTKIEIRIGPTRYTLWNTKQNLQEVNKKLKRLKKLKP